MVALSQWQVVQVQQFAFLFGKEMSNFPDYWTSRNSTGEQAFDFPWGLSPTLWHTYVLLRYLGSVLHPAHHGVNNIIYQHAALGNIRMIKVPADQILSEGRRVRVGLRQDSEGVLLILLVESKLQLVIFANLVMRGKKHLPEQQLCTKCQEHCCVTQ